MCAATLISVCCNTASSQASSAVHYRGKYVPWFSVDFPCRILMLTSASAVFRAALLVSCRCVQLEGLWQTG